MASDADNKEALEDVNTTHTLRVCIFQISFLFVYLLVSYLSSLVVFLLLIVDFFKHSWISENCGSFMYKKIRSMNPRAYMTRKTKSR